MPSVWSSNKPPARQARRGRRVGWILGALLVALAFVAPLHAQSGTIRGAVVEEGTNRPLAGAQIFVMGTKIGTLTNASGQYLLVGVPAGTQQVQAQIIGFGTGRETVAVQDGETATANFRLGQSAIALDEVVVTGAGQATQVKKLGNTVATINTRELEEAPVANMSEILQGREPGVSALPTGGVAGEGTKIRIRGTSSLSQSNEPIIYVDGVRVDNGGGMGGLDQGGGSPSRLDDINPAAIERIEVLKGAAAATLYGTEASNGVIQIFTKQGSAGEPRWNLQLEQGVSAYPEDRYKPLAGFARTPEQASALSTLYGQDIQPFNVFEVDQFPRLFETGSFSNYSLSVNGGNEQVTYFVSGRLLDEDGPFRNNGFGLPDNGLDAVQDVNTKRQMNANVSFMPWDNVRVRANSMYIDSNQEVPDNNNNIYGTISTLVNSKPERASDVNPTGSVPTFGSIREMMFRRTSQDARRFAGSIGTTYTPLESLNLEATVGVDVVSEQNVRFVPFGWNVDNLSGSTPTGTRTVRDRNQRQFTLDTKASWNDDLTDIFSSAFVVGAQAFYTETVRSGGTGAKFAGPGLEVIEAGADQTVFEKRLSQVSAGVYAQEQLGFNDYLFLTLGARYDQHSAFGETAGGVIYPKVSVSFVPSDMPGWNLPLVSSLRVRAAVGQSGLQPGAFDKLTTYEPLNSFTGAGVAPNNLGNPDLKPEVSTEYEAGVDVGFFENRAGLNVTYWDRTVADMLVPRQFVLSGGFQNTQLVNIGEMKAQGVEIGVNGVAVTTPNFSLDLFANAAYLYEQVTDMGGAPPIKPGYYRYGNWIREGYSPGAFFGPKLVDAEFPIDVNRDGKPDTREELVAFFAQPRAVETIRTLLADEDGDGDFLDHYLGKPTPDWTGSFGGAMTFLRNFKLNTMFEYKRGNYQVHNLTDAFRRSHGLIGRNIRKSAETEAVLLNPASTAEQRVEAARIWATEMSALSPQDRLNEIEDADLVRWRELSLTYSVPASFVERFGFGMNNLDLTLGGRNLALWTKYTGVDPEINVVGGRDADAESQAFNNFVTGVEGWGFALPRRVTISASIGF